MQRFYVACVRQRFLSGNGRSEWDDGFLKTARKLWNEYLLDSKKDEC